MRTRGLLETARRSFTVSCLVGAEFHRPSEWGGSTGAIEQGSGTLKIHRLTSIVFIDLSNSSLDCPGCRVLFEDHPVDINKNTCCCDGSGPVDVETRPSQSRSLPGIRSGTYFSGGITSPWRAVAFVLSELPKFLVLAEVSARGCLVGGGRRFRPVQQRKDTHTLRAPWRNNAAMENGRQKTHNTTSDRGPDGVPVQPGTPEPTPPSADKHCKKTFVSLRSPNNNQRLARRAHWTRITLFSYALEFHAEFSPAAGVVFVLASVSSVFSLRHFLEIYSPDAPSLTDSRCRYPDSYLENAFRAMPSSMARTSGTHFFLAGVGSFQSIAPTRMSMCASSFSRSATWKKLSIAGTTHIQERETHIFQSEIW